MSKTTISLMRIAPCLLAIVIDNLGFGLVYPMMASLLTSQTGLLPHATSQSVDFYLGLSYLLYPLCMFFGASSLGDLSDLYGRKKIILLCMGGLAVSFFFMGLGVTASSLFLILLGRALSGLFAGSQPIVQASIVDQSTPKTKALNMSLIGLTLSVGLIIGPIIGGVFSDSAIAKSFNFSTPFYLSAVVSALCFVWIMFSFEETFRKTRAKTLDFLRPIRIFFLAFQNAKLRSISFIFLLMQVGFSLFFTIALIYLKKAFGYANWELGMYNGWIGVSFAIGMFFIARKVAGKYPAEKIAAISMLVTAVGQLLFFLPLSQGWVWVLALPIGASDMLAYTTMLTSFSNIADAKSQGWVMGIAVAVMSVAWVISGFGTNLLDVMSANQIVGIGGVLLLFSGTMMLGFARRHAS
ncbi:MAG: MFS transporter [Verrucomicrobia bacterium]|nr:MFS transporter [Verrucomicrobiota bacterium]